MFGNEEEKNKSWKVFLFENGACVRTWVCVEREETLV